MNPNNFRDLTKPMGKVF